MLEGSQQPQAPAPLTEVGRLKTLLEEISVSLRSQRDILKVRGIQLPPMTMQTLSGIGTELDRLQTNLDSEQTEIGQLRALARNAAQINSQLDLNNVLSETMDVIIALTGAERGYIILVNEETGELDFRVVRENEAMTNPRRGGAEIASGSEPQISQSIVREVLSSGEPLLADNAYGDERLQNNVSIAALTLRSVLCVPLSYREKALGVVYVDNRLRQGVFTNREKTLLAGFANQAAVAMSNAQLYTQLQRTLAEITRVKELTDNVFESIGSGVATIDESDRVMTFNRAAALILEQEDREAVIGEPLSQVLTELNLNLGDEISKVRNTHEAQVIDSEFDTPRRGGVILNVKLSPLRTVAQENQGVALVIDDLTEQRDREQMLATTKRYLPPQMVDKIHEIAKLDLGGERREVTCLYIDTRPIASFPAGLRPQQIMEMVNVNLATATDCLHATNAVIDKYMGTIVMALFNSQLNPMDNHAAQAIEAGLMLREAFAALYQQLGIDPDPAFYRGGINTGVATLGNVGSVNRRDFTAIGDTINLAKRLEENAASGQIITSDTTLSHFKANSPAEIVASVRFEGREPVKAKGRQQPTPVYEIFRQ